MTKYIALLVALVVGAETASAKDTVSNVMLAANAIIDRQITEAAVKLSTIQRQRDPFGVSVSADVLLVSPQQQALAVEAPKLPTIADAIKGLSIDAVSPGKREFQIGGRIIKCGEVLKLRHRGLMFEAKVTEVTPYAVIYEDVKDGTKAAVNLGIIPQLPELK